jgi:hypothetical protein
MQKLEQNMVTQLSYST